MKTNKFFLGMAALAAMVMATTFTSCSNDDKEQLNDRSIQFTAGTTATVSRVGGNAGNEWEGNESIGIFMIDHEPPYNIAENAENVEYTTTTKGTSAIFSGLPIYYPVNNPEKVDFIAYHPYANLTDTYTYAVNVSDQSSQSDIDLMWAKATNSDNGYDKNFTNPVNFTFVHQLAKVVIKVKPGEGIENFDALDVQIKGMKTQATFNVFKSILGNGKNVEAITPKEITEEVAYEAILLPVALEAQEVEFNIGDESYTWTMKNNTVEAGGSISALEAGKKYIFTITLNKMLITATGEITQWGTTDDATGDAN